MVLYCALKPMTQGPGLTAVLPVAGLGTLVGFQGN